ncbi:MAG: 16S rRNA (adenine(1518)-N(6)/adenine(1519)-N(6))-dimethyltransferase RsmA [Clostridiales bacterium]|nr:16S rRNA (adenine(1518)-N(6)/adenine(1519)-N(6))-dimethyltransferase RsmA [Clostridiales bacterium]MBQ3322659.1 16S rRNA (adenine(1518)-N(6)/adenine(1519)-N(6))-dimethyltransferase RsmA [Bacillota bacterium]
MDLSSPGTVKSIREKYGLQLSKSLGQNFITDRNILDKIIEGAGVEDGDMVIEIGPGIGVLTAELAERASFVTAIEIDGRLIPILEETLSEYNNIKIINQDILKTDLGGIIEESRQAGRFTGKVHIIGNLPYYITTPIIMKLLEEQVPADSITVMMQKEVADRIRSAPGSRTYGAISVAVQYYCRVTKVADVPKEAFVPRPKVESTVLNLEPLDAKAIELKDEKLFMRCIKAGFAQRRKTLLNSLASAGGMDKDKVKKILASAGIDPGRRAETLTVEEFGRIANETADE